MKSYIRESDVLIFESSELLVPFMAVTYLYFLNGEYEVPIGEGYVLHKQENGLLQAKVSNKNPTYKDIWEKIVEGNADEIKKIKMIPRIFQEAYLQEEPHAG